MEWDYIDENLKKIIQNPDSVLYLKPYDIGNKRALFAIVKEEQGVYKKVQITKELSKLVFPYEPIFLFNNGPGYLYLKNFIIHRGWLALNTTNLDGFYGKKLDGKKLLNVKIYATFNDGTATYVTCRRKKGFEKNGGIESYIDLLRQHKEYTPKHDTYRVIESYDVGDDTIIIPELRKKVEEEQKVKKLTRENKKQD